jgi:hypothetical protein
MVLAFALILFFVQVACNPGKTAAIHVQKAIVSTGEGKRPRRA